MKERTMKQINDRGQILIYFTLSFVLLGLFIGLAIDGGRAYLLKAQLARKVDPAALAAASRINSGGIGAATAAACNAALMNGMNCADLTITQTTVTDPAGNPVDGVQVSASAIMPTTFMRLGNLIGCGPVCNAITVSAAAVAAPGGITDLVMDLDTTSSMRGSNLTNAKIGANALVDAVFPSGGTPTTLVGLVPFRGCYNVAGSNGCVDPDEYPNNGGDIVSLSNNNTTLHNGVNALAAPPSGAGSGTNVCEGLKKSRQELFEAGLARPNAARYIVVLTDAENSVDSAVLPFVSADCTPTGGGNLNYDLGVRTNTMATNIKTGVAGDGQQAGQTVTIFVIMYGPNATGSVPANCDPSLLTNTANPPDSLTYTKTLARCIASSAGDVYLAPTAASISAAFFDIISRLPVRLLS
jgi:hypothetical protein